MTYWTLKHLEELLQGLAVGLCQIALPLPRWTGIYYYLQLNYFDLHLGFIGEGLDILFANSSR